MSYIKFLSDQVKEYFFNSYHMKMLGFDYPNIYSYIRNIMYEINECIDNSIKNNKRPFPNNIIEYLGKNQESNHRELYSVIKLLLKQKGYKIIGGFHHYDEIEPIDDERQDLSILSSNLLKLLELSNEELRQKQENANKTMDIEEINLKEYLEQDISKDKSLSLK